MLNRSHLFASIALFSISLPSQASIHITGSVSASTTNVPLQSAHSQYSSGTIEMDLGRFVRIGVTHGRESQVSEGYKPADSNTAGCPSSSSCTRVLSATKIIDNSIGLTLILYAGEIFMPYITGGGIMKTYTFESQEESGNREVRTGQTPPVPNVGAGLGIKLNREFMLKLTYQASPGQVQRPGDAEPRGVWDKKTTVGLSYQL